MELDDPMVLTPPGTLGEHSDQQTPVQMDKPEVQVLRSTRPGFRQMVLYQDYDCSLVFGVNAHDNPDT